MTPLPLPTVTPAGVCPHLGAPVAGGPGRRCARGHGTVRPGRAWRLRQAAGGCVGCPDGPGGPAPAAAPAELGRCEHVGKRTEFRAGCVSGERCGHLCDHPDPIRRAAHPTAVPLGGSPAHPGADCRTCPDHSGRAEARQSAAELPPAVLDMGAMGLGDTVLGLFAVGGVVATGRRVVYRVPHGSIPWAGLFEGPERVTAHAGVWGRDAPQPGGHAQLNRGYDTEVRTRGQLARVHRYCRNAGGVAPVRPRLREPDRLRELGRRWAGVVALAPWSHYRNREASPAFWRAVEAELHRRGYRTVVLHSSAQRCEAFERSEVMAGGSPEDVAGLLLNAACTVGIDSGIAHLSAAVGTPTVVLGGPTRGAQVFGAYERVTALDGPLPCSGCYFQWPYTGAKCHPCPSIGAIGPDRVADAVDAWALPAFAGGRSLMGWEKLRTLRDELLRTRHLSGDVAELGVYRGGSAAVLARFAGGSTVRLFDTFRGLPSDDQLPGGHRAGEFAADLADVRAWLAPWPGVTFHPGEFPGTAPPDPIRYRVAHLDADMYQSTRDALAYFVPRMERGGAIVFDDFGWPQCPGVERAVREAGLVTWNVAHHQAVVRF